MKCSNCGFEQEEGKFCGKCGTPMVTQQQPPHQEEQTAKQQEPSQAGVNNPGQNDDSLQQSHADQHAGQTVSNRPTQQPGTLHVSQQQQAAQTDDAQQSHHTYEEAVATATPASSDAMAKMKHTSKAYWAYFVQHLKRPSDIFQQGAAELKNGLITIAIAIILISISGYWLVKNLANAAYSYGSLWRTSDIDVPFFSIAGNVFLYSIILLAIVVVIVFVTCKIAGIRMNFQTFISIFGAHTVFIAVVAAAAFLLLLLKANTIGAIALFVAIGLLVTSMPLYLISHLLTKYTKHFDAYYGYLLYIVFAAIAFSIYLTILADSSIGNLLDSVNGIF